MQEYKNLGNNNLYSESTEVKINHGTGVSHFDKTKQVIISTDHGPLHVFVQGDRTKPAIITYHDVGLNHVSCWEGFFSYDLNQKLWDLFCIYHIDAPGQSLSDVEWEGPYLTIEQLSDQVEQVTEYFGIKQFIGLGASAGASVLLQYAVKYEKKSQKLGGLMLISPVASPPSWFEWGFFNAGIMHVKSNFGQMTNFFVDMLMNKYFSGYTLHGAPDLVDGFRYNLTHELKPINMALYMQAYLSRPNLAPFLKDIKCRNLILSGYESACVIQVDEVYAELPSDKTSYIKSPYCGTLVHEENPGRFGLAVCLYLTSLYINPSLTNKLVALEKEYSKNDAAE